MKSGDQRYGDKIAGDKEKKINGGSATADQVRDWSKGLKQKLLEIVRCYKKPLITQSL
jgi:hypothetical protein